MESEREIMRQRFREMNWLIVCRQPFQCVSGGTISITFFTNKVENPQDASVWIYSLGSRNTATFLLILARICTATFT